MARKADLQIATANHLTEGHSVFLTPSGWSSDHHQALLASGADEAASLESRAKLDEDRNLVVGVYLVEVAMGADGQPEPTHYRERLRVRARPSFWADAPSLTGAAKAAIVHSGAAHVSV